MKILTKGKVSLKAVDPRFGGIKISIVDDRFEYELKAPFIEKYSLIFEDDFRRGSFRPIWNFGRMEKNMNFKNHLND